MGVIDGLMADKVFIIKSLISLINEERYRIVGASLVDKKSCDKYLNSFFNKLASNNTNMTNDEMISHLNLLYDSMQNVKIMGDKFFEEEEKANNIPPEIKTEPEPKNISGFVKNELEKIAYDLGSSGNHTMAFEVEMLIKDIK